MQHRLRDPTCILARFVELCRASESKRNDPDRPMATFSRTTNDTPYVRLPKSELGKLNMWWANLPACLHASSRHPWLVKNADMGVV